MISNDKKITLITGANSGIGFALAQLLLADASNIVLLGARSLSKGQAAISDLRPKTSPAPSSSFKSTLDALVNNAGIAGGYSSTGADVPDGQTLSEQLIACFTTNTVGPAITVHYFAPLLSVSPHVARIVNVSSGAGSISLRADHANPHQAMKVVPYRVSKAALHMVTACQCFEYREKRWRVFNFCPGFTESNLGLMNTIANGAKPASEGARPVLAILRGDRDVESGGFLNSTEKRTWPW
ncbi:hypothetical protein HBI17_103720 [Parastagonospora nodorum]|nr:hypothetical protein HBI78_066200 [Parastagonospora nodorum]KAH5201671.1 hypothetical protein HBH77_123740 [Parastagonospora nodorum]KAH5749829.1 hypothetical protein HBI17_103720 [Parastagonospora nodorum]